MGESTSDRQSKKRALERILKQVNTVATLDALPLFQSLHKTVLKGLSDPVEKCRELCVQILGFFVQKLDIGPFLVALMPCLVAQLGQMDLVEPSEEIRFLLVKTLGDVIASTQASFSPFVEDTVLILGRCLADPYPQVKKEACRLVQLLCQSNKQALSLHGDKITKQLIPAILHKHSSVRVVALQALCEAMIVDATGLDEALGPLWDLCFDKSPAVREAVYALAHGWLSRIVIRLLTRFFP